MTKISADHLARGAYVYIRQSTSYQVANNTESGRRQYGLVERAHQLGFPEVHVIDDDLGRSGGGVARPVRRAGVEGAGDIEEFHGTRLGLVGKVSCARVSRMFFSRVTASAQSAKLV